MSVPKVVHCKKEPYDVLIDRTTDWGNPFFMTNEASRDTVIAQYAEYLLGRPDLLERLVELKGKTLGCWCAPKRCHGDILLELANS